MWLVAEIRYDPVRGQGINLLALEVQPRVPRPQPVEGVLGALWAQAQLTPRLSHNKHDRDVTTTDAAALAPLLDFGWPPTFTHWLASTMGKV